MSRLLAGALLGITVSLVLNFVGRHDQRRLLAENAILKERVDALKEKSNGA